MRFLCENIAVFMRNADRQHRGHGGETDPDILTKLCLRSKIGRVQAYTQQIQGDKYRVFETGFAATAGMDSCSATAIFLIRLPFYLF